MIDIVERFPVDNAEVSGLLGRAFGVSPPPAFDPAHALTWVGAFSSGRLVGFVKVVWDGGQHAFILDTAVDPSFQRRGIGVRVVRAAADAARAAGCGWLHVDYEPHLDSFYRDGCGFRPTLAGLMSLDSAET